MGVTTNSETIFNAIEFISSVVNAFAGSLDKFCVDVSMFAHATVPILFSNWLNERKTEDVSEKIDIYHRVHLVV